MSLLLLLTLVLAPMDPPDARSDWETLKTKDKGVDERALAVRSLVERASADNECGRVVPELIEFALRPTTPHPLQKRIAAEISGCSGDATVRILVQRMGQGQAPERDFTLRAARNVHASEIDKALVTKGLTDDDAKNRRAALDILVFHACAAAVPALEDIYVSGKEPELVRPAIAGISAILQNTAGWSAWEARLIELARGGAEAARSNGDPARDNADEVRRSALLELARLKDAMLIEVFVQALSNSDWSTRVIALDYLSNCNSKGAVTAIVAQMQHEPPGTRMNNECRHVLERISGGMSFGDRAQDWATWWRNNQATFAFSDASAPSTPDRKPVRPQSGDTHVDPTFYGLKVESQRVCFVIDVSGSMQDPAQASDGSETTRIGVARRELDKIIGELPPGSLFNIIAFDTKINAWVDRLGDLPPGVDTRGRKVPTTGDPREKESPAESDKDAAQKQKEAELRRKLDDALRAKARVWVDKLVAHGGTNMNDALEMAFADPLVDTIFLLTDGMPSAGKRIDPEEIRVAVRGWNATRRIELHTIAIGAELPLVMELAQDNGGQYRYCP